MVKQRKVSIRIENKKPHFITRDEKLQILQVELQEWEVRWDYIIPVGFTTRNKNLSRTHLYVLSYLTQQALSSHLIAFYSDDDFLCVCVWIEIPESDQT